MFKLQLKLHHNNKIHSAQCSVQFYGVCTKNCVYIPFIPQLLQAGSPCSTLVHRGYTGLYSSHVFSWQPDNAGGWNGEFCCDCLERLLLMSAWRVGGNNATTWMREQFLFRSREAMRAKIGHTVTRGHVSQNMTNCHERPCEPKYDKLSRETTWAKIWQMVTRDHVRQNMTNCHERPCEPIYDKCPLGPVAKPRPEILFRCLRICNNLSSKGGRNVWRNLIVSWISTS
jgi:hypothetical protein